MLPILRLHLWPYESLFLGLKAAGEDYTKSRVMADYALSAVYSEEIDMFVKEINRRDYEESIRTS